MTAVFIISIRHFINANVCHFSHKKGLLLPFYMAKLLNPNSISEDLHQLKHCCVPKSNLTFHLLWMEFF